MKKIPTILVRNPDDRAHVLMEITPGCEWVFASEGIATRKYDGTCVMFDGERWWARREVKPGKAAPANYVPVETDETTGKTVGWEPIEQSAFVKFWREAADANPAWRLPDDPRPGTYELIGPKVNGNPEGAVAHALICHEFAERYPAMSAPQSVDELVRAVAALPWEGIVWHHPDGRMAKLKRRDIA